MPDLTFPPLGAEHLRQVYDWLQRPHVKRWWPEEEEETFEEVAAEYLAGIEGREPTDHRLIAVDGRPVGMIQTYLVSDYPDWEALVHVGDGVAGIDLFIGEEDATGRGLGVEVISAFVRDVVFAQPETHACVAGVEIENGRSLRAFEKAGFRPVLDYEEEGRSHRLLRLERDP